jgi:hypothetical protein
LCCEDGRWRRCPAAERAGGWDVDVEDDEDEDGDDNEGKVRLAPGGTLTMGARQPMTTAGRGAPRDTNPARTRKRATAKTRTRRASFDDACVRTGRAVRGRPGKQAVCDDGSGNTRARVRTQLLGGVLACVRGVCDGDGDLLAGSRRCLGGRHTHHTSAGTRSRKGRPPLPSHMASTATKKVYIWRPPIPSSLGSLFSFSLLSKFSTSDSLFFVTLFSPSCCCFSRAGLVLPVIILIFHPPHSPHSPSPSPLTTTRLILLTVFKVAGQL